MIQTSLKPKGTLTLQFGAITAVVTGGPFDYSTQLPEEFVRVKLAQEIKLPCEIDLPIRDFSVPNGTQAKQAVRAVLQAASDGRPVYVGCMAGQGRTGLFLSLLVKVAHDFSVAAGVPVAEDFAGPVEYVRQHYYPHAVETSGQYDFVEQFDTADLVAFVASLQPAPVETFAGALCRFAAALAGFGKAFKASLRFALTGRV